MSARPRARFFAAVVLAAPAFLGGCASAPVPERRFAVESGEAIRALQADVEQAIQGFEGIVGVYARRLGETGEVAIRADETFPTASLVKVPILLGLLDRLEKKEVSWTVPLTYTRERRYSGEDLLGRVAEGEEVDVAELIFLMESKSDNSASLWCQELAGSGTAINSWLETKGWKATRVNSRTHGREKERELWGWGQTTPREMAGLLVAIRERRAVSCDADAYADRALGRTFWVDESLSSIPPSVHVISKQGAVNASRSEVLLVSAPSGPFVICVITKEQKDQSWERSNAGYRLLRKITALAWARFEPGAPYPPSLDGPAWP
ncbi:MAG: serine hydrolase [Holophagales bacterium]|jgi:beta-lactamase class A|nr:serine hydrolase [Holophagales bacterium]